MKKIFVLAFIALMFIVPSCTCSNNNETEVNPTDTELVESSDSLATETVDTLLVK